MSIFFSKPDGEKVLIYDGSITFWDTLWNNKEKERETERVLKKNGQKGEETKSFGGNPNTITTINSLSIIIKANTELYQTDFIVNCINEHGNCYRRL